MCVTSYIGEIQGDDIYKRYPWSNPNLPFSAYGYVGLDEFMKLKKEVEELKILLEAAKKYDEATGQKNCSKDEKVAALRRIAELVGVDLKDVLT